MSNQVHKIEIADEQSQPLDPAPLIAAVEQILIDHQVANSEISIAIVDDPTIRSLNRQYLDHDYETDVISFVLDEDQERGSLSGQLVVSTDTAGQMAKEMGGTLQEELLLYVIHGTLHLVGYDDKNPSEASKMRAAEKRYLQSFGIEHRWSPAESDAELDDVEVDAP